MWILDQSACWTQFLSFSEFTTESEAFPERSDGEAGDGEAEMGDGVQGLPGICGRIHEHAGTVFVCKKPPLFVTYNTDIHFLYSFVCHDSNG